MATPFATALRRYIRTGYRPIEAMRAVWHDVRIGRVARPGRRRRAIRLTELTPRAARRGTGRNPRTEVYADGDRVADWRDPRITQVTIRSHANPSAPVTSRTVTRLVRGDPAVRRRPRVGYSVRLSDGRELCHDARGYYLVGAPRPRAPRNPDASSRAAAVLRYYAYAPRRDGTIGQLLVERAGGRTVRQTWTGVTYRSARAAAADVGRLNRRLVTARVVIRPRTNPELWMRWLPTQRKVEIREGRDGPVRTVPASRDLPAVVFRFPFAWVQVASAPRGNPYYYPGLLDLTDPRVIRGRPIAPGARVMITRGGARQPKVDPLGRLVWIMDESGNEQSVWRRALSARPRTGNNPRSVSPEAKLATLRRIVAHRQTMRIGAEGSVDAFTASAILGVYDRLGAANQARYLAMPVRRMADIAWTLIGKGSNPEIEIYTPGAVVLGFDGRRMVLPPEAGRRNPRGRRSDPSRARYCPERLEDPRRFDRRSFRTVVQAGHRITVGCPRGQWDPRRRRCRVGTRAQRVLHPVGEGRCPVGGRELARARRNAPPRARLTRFYDRITEIRGVKGPRFGYPPGTRFRHPFTTQPAARGVDRSGDVYLRRGQVVLGGRQPIYAQLGAGR